MAKEQFLSSVYMIIKNEKGEILLQKRQGTKLWCGYYALPAGHVDEGENSYDAVIREAKEELGITLSTNDIVDTFVACRRNTSLPPYFDVYFEISKYEGDIQIMEPEKCAELIWRKPAEFPENTINFEKVALDLNQKGIKFSVIDEENK